MTSNNSSTINQSYNYPPKSSRLAFSKLATRKNLWLASLSLLFIIGLLWAFKALASTTPTRPTSTANQTQLPGPIASKPIDRELSIPIKNDKGEEVAKIKYVIQSAELTNDIVVQGVKKTSVQGRTFLLINLKIINESSKRFQIDTRDYVRLTVNGNDKEPPLAPDIHNDPVEVQAVSTKPTRVGFIINTSDKNLKLKIIGDVSGDKSPIDLNF